MRVRGVIQRVAVAVALAAAAAAGAQHRVAKATDAGAQASGVEGVAAPAGFDVAQPLTRIAFGSCAEQGKPQPIWDAVLATEPELFVFLGDNVYGDTRERAVLERAYAKLAAQPGFRRWRPGMTTTSAKTTPAATTR